MHLKHRFVSAKADGTDVTLVKPSNWNDEHDLATDADGVVLGRAVGATPGPVQELPISSFYLPGMMLMYGGSTAPTGWLLCQGQSLVRVDYPALFAVIGTAFGSVDSSHFSLPDLRGRAPAGPDGGTGRLFNWVLGNTGGESSHVLGWNEMPAHNHTATVSDPTHQHQLPVENFGLGGSGGGNVPQAITGNMFTYGAATGISVTISNAGGNVAHNNTQPTAVVNFIIKT